ncbi:16S rRNA (guanine(527)-N(7))-methyltransferase RsmG [Fervidobacterium thailandense]|uniref:Ribosomal RNA small subunit methyltransferase G n=1 Tax=Fervidobacterium thailandense TaxID=1008305 RepID=A0A1E3G0A9_9BACT|nr:16S rRNA (guanine(527)-N(7))-methyltransferase RsmG [Fervidobacterium thailandense]ODN29655.1 16S rRNA (guanine(527)-N(7))-methyltransferase RsmG [Fervidobacterium thailandense]
METSEKLELVRRYLDRIINAPLNLTAFRDLQEAFTHLYIDSVLAVKPHDLGECFLDVGTGGGVPGVFLAIEFGKRGLLIDSVCKKVEYVRRVCEELGITNVTTMCIRAEDLKNSGNYFESFDSAVCRAVASLATVLELTVPYVKLGGRVLIYKGPGYTEELGNSVNAMKELGVKLSDVRCYSIQGKDRYLLVFEKIANTPEKYPRRAGIPEKRPIR